MPSSTTRLYLVNNLEFFCRFSFEIVENHNGLCVWRRLGAVGARVQRLPKNRFERPLFEGLKRDRKNHVLPTARVRGSEWSVLVCK